MNKLLAQATQVYINPPTGKIPTIETIIAFAVKALFIVAGLLAFLYLILGGIKWITSGGNKEDVTKARDQIQAAIIGLILVFAVLAIVALMEQILGVGLGITAPIEIPSINMQ